MKKARTAYFVFSEENRALAREDLLRERGEGAKISVAEVAKELGQRWQQLTQAEKDAFKEKAQHQHAAAMQAEAHAAAQDGAAEGEEQQQQHGGGEGVAEQAGGKADKESTPLDGLLAASVIRRVMQADEDMARISADGAVAVAMATDALLGMLARLAAGSARGQKRRTLMLKDFAQAIKQDRRLAQAGLRDVEAAVTAVTEAEAAAKSQAKEAAEVVTAAKEADKEAVAEGRAEAAGEVDDGEAGARAEGDAMEEGEEAGRENEAPQGQGAQGETEGLQGGGGAEATKEDGKKGGGRGRKKKASGGEGGEGAAAGRKPNAADSKKQKLAKAAEGARKIDTFFTKAS